MRRVEPRVYLVGESALDTEAVRDYLRDVGAIEWADGNLSGRGGSELLTEVMGRLCYKSWKPGLNLNVKKVREGNDVYLRNILESKHGSVIEHGSSNWIFNDVSRVFTHELVRHRAGCAYSQESLRYVRMDDLGFWMPKDPEITPEIEEMCEGKVAVDEEFCKILSDKLGLNDHDKSFAYKKKWTSFVRRFAPQGMATAIGVTINFRALRHVLEMRTAESAEVEIRLVFDKVGQIAKMRWPNLFQDSLRTPGGEWKFGSSKI